MIGAALPRASHLPANVDETARGQQAAGGQLPRSAAAFLFAVAAAAAAGIVPAGLTFNPHAKDWTAFLILATCAGASSLFVVATGRNHGFHTAVLFIIAAALLLPPELVALMGIGQHMPDWVRRRYPWYIQTFNISNYTLNALAAWATARLVMHSGLPGAELRWAAGAFAAGVVLVAINHLVLATMLLLARGHSFRESGLFSGQSLFNDFALAGLGVGLAFFWRLNPYLIPALVVPLLLIQRSFSVLALLRQSEERFRAIFDSTAIGIRLSDLDGRFLASNHPFEEMVGQTHDELAGRTFAEFTHPDDREAELELFRAMLEGENESYQVEERLLRPDGEVLWANLTSSLVRDADGKPTFAIGMVQDVTQHKLLEEQLRQAQKMEAIGRLAGGIAHDFNNLVTIIETYTAFVLHELEGPNEALRRDVEEIKKAGQRAASLTGQLLAFSRRQVLQPEVLDLNAVLSDTYNMLGRLIGEHIEITTELSPSLGCVKADPGQIEQVLINLAVNARDAMAKGGKLTIETTNVDFETRQVDNGVEVAAGKYVMLAVSDTGCGMDPATRSRVFEPFFTTKEKSKGTGLGLATVHGIVSQSGGYISIASELDQGTEMRIYLPRVEGAVTAAVEARRSGGGDEGNEIVLLVEDEDVVRGAARRILREQGYHVLEAFDGTEALRIAERHRGPIHLLVTDVVMPQLGGTELAELLRPLRPEMKVLFMSGYTDEVDVSEAISATGGAFLQKPFSESALAAKVRMVLDAPIRESEPVSV